MVDTVRTLPDLQVLLHDNTSGDITPQDVRDFLVSVFPTEIMQWTVPYVFTEDAQPIRRVSFNGKPATAIAIAVRAGHYGYGTTTFDLERAVDSLTPAFASILSAPIQIDALQLTMMFPEQIAVSGGTFSATALADGDLLRPKATAAAGASNVELELTVTTP